MKGQCKHKEKHLNRKNVGIREVILEHWITIGILEQHGNKNWKENVHI